MSFRDSSISIEVFHATCDGFVSIYWPVKRLVFTLALFYHMLTSYFVLKLQPQLIRFWGYDCEVHSVQTRDGYKLEIHRIPRGKDEKPLGYGKTKPVVLLGHGIISSSSAFTFGPPNNSLGYILADTGNSYHQNNSCFNHFCSSKIVSVLFICI